MSYYRVCEHCGANLDPGEICECRNEPDEEAEKPMPRRGTILRGIKKSQQKKKKGLIFLQLNTNTGTEKKQIT